MEFAIVTGNKTIGKCYVKYCFVFAKLQKVQIPATL